MNIYTLSEKDYLRTESETSIADLQEQLLKAQAERDYLKSEKLDKESIFTIRLWLSLEGS